MIQVSHGSLSDLSDSELKMIKQGAQDYLVNEVILHTSATSADWSKNKTVAQMRQEIRNWHVNDRGWKDIGYHWVVAPDGSVAAGRPETVIGAGVEGHNRGVIHICMVPTVAIGKMGRFADFYTAAQRVAVRDMLLRIEKGVGRGKLSVTGHNVYANKLCPGFKVVQEEWL
jgi:N-acetylmuramoyl-L-alanine amidase